MVRAVLEMADDAADGKTEVSVLMPRRVPVPARGLLSTATVGDAFVNIETGINFGRAAARSRSFRPMR